MPKKKTSLAPRPKDPPSAYQNHAYINPDGTVDGERLLKIIRETPGAFFLMVSGRILKQKPAQFDVSGIIEGLTFLFLLAAEGDEKSQHQIKAIEKLIKPAKYELPFTKISEIIDRYETSPPLARGWELRRIMSDLSRVVEPLKQGRPYTPDQPVKLSDKPQGAFAGFWDVAQQHLKPNSTLQSLAIRIYLEQLQKQGVTDEGQAITERTLKRDLARIREWENTASDEEKLRRGRWHGGSMTGGESITWYEFSEGWKDRKKGRKAKGATQKKLLTG